MPSRRFPPPWSVEEQSACYPLLGLTSADTATARVYDCGVGPGTNALSPDGLRFDGPDEVSTSFGALRQGRRFACRTAALLCSARVARKCVTLGPHPAYIRLQSEPHLPSDFVCVDDLGDERAREAASLLGMGRANPRFDRTAP